MTDISKSNFLKVGSPIMAEFGEKELERRLSLYQVFMKLYEHHSSLLEDILKIENIHQPSFPTVKPYYVQGIVDGSVVYVITNLCEGKTLSLQQPQKVWTIGRERACGIHVTDKHVSRYHAAIQHIDSQGFYLVDLNSTNGSYINGEPIYQPKNLQDGDRIRLGDVTFSFFTHHTTCILPTIAVDLSMQLVASLACVVDKPSYVATTNTSLIQREQDFLDEELTGTSSYSPSLCTIGQSEILDSFMHQKLQ